MSIKAADPYWVRNTARMLLHQLAYAASKDMGVPARDIKVSGGNYRQAAARYLRECGLPIYARRKGEDSAWFLLLETDNPAFLAEWKKRILTDAYAEVCRAHMALEPHQWSKAEARELRQIALTLGGWLNLDPLQVLVDIKPRSLSNALKNIMSSLADGSITED